MPYAAGGISCAKILWREQDRGSREFRWCDVALSVVKNTFARSPASYVRALHEGKSLAKLNTGQSSQPWLEFGPLDTHILISFDRK